MRAGTMQGLLLCLVAPFATPWAPPSSTRRAASLTLRATRAPKFFEAGSIIDVRVDSLSSLGDGVGRVRSNLTGSDVVVFLPFAAPGDVVRARVTEERKRSCRSPAGEVPRGRRRAHLLRVGLDAPHPQR